MSGSESINAIYMMESVALNDESSHVVHEDIDYVLVEKDNDDDMMDEDSYDYCDDVVSMLSVDQPSSLSVCSDLPSIDPTVLDLDVTTELKPERRPRLISFGNDEDEVRTRPETFQTSIEPLEECVREEEQSCDSAEMSAAESTDDIKTEPITDKAAKEPENPPARSRLSNKKRRKKMKLMKKAAAAAAAAAALSAATEMAALVPPSSPSKPRRKAKPTSRSSKKVTNVAVACVTRTMEDYRQELENNKKKKGSSKLTSIV